MDGIRKREKTDTVGAACCHKPVWDVRIVDITMLIVNTMMHHDQGHHHQYMYHNNQNEL
jgi:hypothetical protein